VRTAFLGTSEFACAVLERLAASPHRPALVVTRPDRPRGRGRLLAPPPVASAARALGLPVEQPERVNEPAVLERIATAAPDALCLCAYGALIADPLLSTWTIYNVHPSLLPRWRGAAPIERAIMAGDAETGVSIMRLVAELDAGPVCLAGAEPIRPEDDFGALAARLAALGGELLVRALDEQPPFVPQDDARATYAEKLGPADRLLDPERPVAELERQVRALTPHVGARLELADGAALGVARARVVAGEAPAGPGVGQLAAREGRLLLGCADGALELLVVKPPGGSAMDAAAYLRGHPLR